MDAGNNDKLKSRMENEARARSDDYFVGWIGRTGS